MTARSRDDGARSRREAAAHRVRGISFIVEPSRRELIEIGRSDAHAKAATIRAAEHITKPVSLDRLLAVVRKYSATGTTTN